MYYLKRMLLIASVVALGSQLFVNFFVEGFIVTFAIIILPLSLYLHPHINPLTQCLVVAVVSPLFRFFIEYLSNKDFYYTLSIVWPDIGFYIFYGLIFYFIYWNEKEGNLKNLIFTIFMADFGANMAELLLRTQVRGMELEIIRGLVLIALVRTALVSLTILFISKYKSMLIRTEHEDRYRKLVLLTSSFKSEIYFMQKNMQNIEAIMNKSYKTHKLTIQVTDNEDLQKLTLDIAKDIHEIKKDYIQVIKGLEDINTEKLNLEEMHIKDLFNIIITNTKEVLRHDGKPIKVNTHIHSDVIILNHYYFTSILRNLINNSIEALDDVPKPVITLSVYEHADEVVTICSDNGNGINPTDIDYIFNPGFSTKFDVASGNISRGLGLTLVNELITDFFKGTVTVSSTSLGTTMEFKIKKHILANKQI